MTIQTQEKYEINHLSSSLIKNELSNRKISITHNLEDLLQNLVNEITQGNILWNKNVINSIKEAIKKIDKKISTQLSEIIHHEKFQSLESSWRGLNYLVKKTNINANLKIKTLDISKNEIIKDFSKSDFEQSKLFKLLYEQEFGTPGGEPFGILVGDYYFSHAYDDIDALSKISHVSASSFCPFISSASPDLFGFNNWNELSKPRDLEKIFEGKEYIKWNSLRESDDARFITLTLPRVLSRVPFGKNTKQTHNFNFEEILPNHSNPENTLKHKDYSWMNAAYALAERITNSFSQYQWCTSIRGAENGGKVTNLPIHTHISQDGDLDIICPTEISITDRREAELSRLGFLPLSHYKNTDYAVFFGAQTLQKPGNYDKIDAKTNAAISARLPYIMATSRFAHYLKIIARDKIGALVNTLEVETILMHWVSNYVNANTHAGQEMKAKYPLAEAKVQVSQTPGKPGSYHIIAWLRPWLQLEELTTSLRLVANIPKAS